jgi:hypothetical protein
MKINLQTLVSPHPSIYDFLVELTINVRIHQHNRVVHDPQIIDGLGQWLSHVTRHKLKQLALIASTKNEAKPNEKKPNEAAKAFCWQPGLADAKENRDHIVGWHFYTLKNMMD